MSARAEDRVAAAGPPDLEAYLRPAVSVDSDHPDVVAFAHEHTAGVDGPREQTVALHLAVRDGFRYDPYTVDQRPEGFRASTVLARGHGYCLPKSALLAAAARVMGIPSRSRRRAERSGDDGDGRRPGMRARGSGRRTVSRAPWSLACSACGGPPPVRDSGPCR